MLQAVEIEFLITWYNPNASPHLAVPGEEAINEWRARPVKLSLWRDYTRLAWAYNPSLAIYLPQRIRNAESIEDEVTRLVCADPIAVSHISEALKYLVTTKTLLAESHEVTYAQLNLFPANTELVSIPFSWFICSHGHQLDQYKLCRISRANIQRIH